MLLMMGVIILILFRLCTVQVCSRTRANVSYIGFPLLLLVSSMHISAKGVLVQNIQSHSPFVPQFLLRCWFHLNDSVVWCTFSFRSTGIDYLLNLSYYSRILPGNTSVFCHITLPRACELVCDVDECFAHAQLLWFSYFCHLLQCDRKAMRCVLNLDLLNSTFLMV